MTQVKGADAAASIAAPRKDRGTAPLNSKWSYCTAQVRGECGRLHQRLAAPAAPRQRPARA